MKNVFLFLICLLLSTTSFSQVGIGTETPNASAALDLTSTTQGLLPPRMTAAQRNAIASPAQGLMIYCTNCGTNGEAQFYNGAAWVNVVGDAAAAAPVPFACGDSVTFTYNGSSVTYGTVIGASSPSQCWLDRNLGATQVATSRTDAAAYGDLFQWGRGADGHQIRSPLSSPTTGQSSSPSPGANFLIGSSNWYSGSSPNPNDLWKEDGTGVNNPCPAGFRLPTSEEFTSEVTASNITNSDSAFDSPLKFTVPGFRNHSSGALDFVGSLGYYWSSSVSGTLATDRSFSAGGTAVNDSSRAFGFMVRCLKN